MNNVVYLVTDSIGVIGVFSSKYFAEQGLKEYKIKHGIKDENHDYEFMIEHFTLDEVLF